MLSIRAHHLFCTLLFAGHGYSDGFTRGMTETVSLLRSDLSQELCLQCRPDRVCSQCPRLEGSRCSANNDAASAMDAALLERLHLREDRTYTYEELLRTAVLNVREEDFAAVCSAVCGDSSWFAGGYCGAGQMISQAEALLNGKEEQDREDHSRQ